MPATNADTLQALAARHGFVVPPGLTDLLRRVDDDPDLRDAFARAGWEVAVDVDADIDDPCILPLGMNGFGDVWGLYLHPLAGSPPPFVFHEHTEPSVSIVATSTDAFVRAITTDDVSHVQADWLPRVQGPPDIATALALARRDPIAGERALVALAMRCGPDDLEARRDAKQALAELYARLGWSFPLRSPP